MDIFKKLTKGIKFDQQQQQQLNQQSSRSSASNEEKGEQSAKLKKNLSVLPKDLDFFSEDRSTDKDNEEENEAEVETLVSLEEDTAEPSSNAQRFKFKTQKDLDAFRTENMIRLTLHQTSENSALSATTSTQISDINDPEQILPITAFADLDSRLFKRLKEVEMETKSKEEKERERKGELLLSSSDFDSAISSPTPVQMQAVPVMLKGRDMIVMAPTGSGKTLAYLLGIEGRLLAEMDTNTATFDDGTIKALIISPTRELADQIHDQFLQFTPKDPLKNYRPLLRVGHLNKAVVNSWTAQKPSSYPHVLISTPLRLIHALRSNILSIEHLKLLVLDEADRLLADGFDEQLDELLVAMKCPAKVQKALFSATMPSGVEATARTILSAPFRIVCGTLNPNGSTLQCIKQELIFCGNGTHTHSHSTGSNANSILHEESVGKMMALRQLIHRGALTPPVIIFVGSAPRAERLFSDLVQWSMAALGRPLAIDYLHANRSQQERTAVLEAFRKGKIWFLITTDVLARGLDFPPLSAVINYDFPDSTASYIHRIGRTGRAGRPGLAYTLYTSDDLPELRIVVNVMKESGMEVPQWLQDHYSKSKGNSRLDKKLKFTEKEEIKKKQISKKVKSEKDA